MLSFIALRVPDSCWLLQCPFYASSYRIFVNFSVSDSLKIMSVIAFIPPSFATNRSLFWSVVLLRKRDFSFLIYLLVACKFVPDFYFYKAHKFYFISSLFVFFFVAFLHFRSVLRLYSFSSRLRIVWYVSSYFWSGANTFH